MGAQNRRFGSIRNLTDIEVKRMHLQAQIDKSKSVEERRRFGQFATPLAIAQEIVSYGLTLQQNKEITFLEPALGTGAFFSALLSEIKESSKYIKTATGVEIDDEFYYAANEVWRESGIDIIHSDFTETERIGKINFLVSNPPYVRHHYIGQEKKILLSETIKKETGLLLSGLSGLYCYFVLSAHKWLAPNAICGWLIPSEFMDVNYGVTLKQYLLDHVHLLRIHRYEPNECQFDDALVSSCVVWFKNEIVAGNYDIEFTFGGTHNAPEIRRKVDRYSLKKQRKWTRFPEHDFQQDDSTIPTLGDFFSIKRGIATGDNDFFILSKEQIDTLGLDMSFFTPILPSPRHLKSDEILCDINGYPQLDKQYFLFTCTLSEDEIKANYPSVWEYLNKGKDTTAQKYLCKHRKVWYFQEDRIATPFLCSYMGRNTSDRSVPFRFILNHTNAVATNSYLMLYPKTTLQNAISKTPGILYKVWEALRNITASDLELEGRVYGGGLKKIEPKELSCVKCPLLAELLT